MRFNVSDAHSRSVHVQEYDPAWAEWFAAEAARLPAGLAPWLAAEAVEHVGSTAVPGLKAKPIVDMLAAVRSLEEAQAAFPTLKALEYRHRPHRPEAHLFVRDGYGRPLDRAGQRPVAGAARLPGRAASVRRSCAPSTQPGKRRTSSAAGAPTTRTSGRSCSACSPSLVCR